MHKDILSNQAFEIFFKEYYLSVYDYLFRCTGDESLAKDLAQTTFLRIYEHRDKIGKVDSAKAFLYTIARHLYWNYSKHEKVKTHYTEINPCDEIDDRNFLQEVTKTETIRILRNAVQQLPPRTREIISLNMEGKNNNEVAEILNISVNTVKTLKKSAYAILRDSLSKEYLIFLLFLIGD